MKTIKEILNDERTNKVVKILVILNCIRVTVRLVLHAVYYGPKIVERVKNKITERKKQKEEYENFKTMRKMYNKFGGAVGIEKYVRENEIAFEICNNFEEKIV